MRKPRTGDLVVVNAFGNSFAGCIPCHGLVIDGPKGFGAQCLVQVLTGPQAGRFSWYFTSELIPTEGE